MKELDKPLVYLWVHHKLLEHGTIIMPPKRIIAIFRMVVRLPQKQFNYEIIKELEKYGLIIRVNRRGYRVLQQKFFRPDVFGRVDFRNAKGGRAV
jgi:hypothetical protein